MLEQYGKLHVQNALAPRHPVFACVCRPAQPMSPSSSLPFSSVARSPQVLASQRDYQRCKSGCPPLQSCSACPVRAWCARTKSLARTTPPSGSGTAVYVTLVLWNLLGTSSEVSRSTELHCWRSYCHATTEVVLIQDVNPGPGKRS